MKTHSLLATLVLTLSVSAATLAQDIPEEARRHMIRGRAAVEMAKAPEQYRMAIVEFEQAVRLAPHWADAFFNLALAQARLGDLGSAIGNYRRYVELAPNAPDAQKVRDDIVKLEYQLEVKSKVASLAGRWYVVGSWTAYVDVSMNGDSFEAIENGRIRYAGSVAGNIVQGRRTVPGYRDNPSVGSNCMFPDNVGPFTGKISADANTIEVDSEERVYEAAWAISLFDNICKGVSDKGPRRVGGIWYRPGLIGTELDKESRIVAMTPDSPAELAGLRVGDRIISIDGNKTADRPAAYSLRGPAGRPVTLTVARTGAAQPQEFTVTRRAATAAEGNAIARQFHGASATSSGCFIATAAYGSYLDPQVQVLREFRDRYLLTNAPGQAFVEFYYRASPPLAAYIAERPALRAVTRWVLTPLVYVVREPLLALAVLLAGVVGVAAWARRRVMRGGAA